jgi:hypothetical protein
MNISIIRGEWKLLCLLPYALYNVCTVGQHRPFFFATFVCENEEAIRCFKYLLLLRVKTVIKILSYISLFRMFSCVCLITRLAGLC